VIEDEVERRLRNHRHCHKCKRVFLVEELRKQADSWFLVFECPACGETTYISTPATNESSISKPFPSSYQLKLIWAKGVSRGI